MSFWGDPLRLVFSLEFLGGVGAIRCSIAPLPQGGVALVALSQERKPANGPTHLERTSSSGGLPKMLVNLCEPASDSAKGAAWGQAPTPRFNWWTPKRTLDLPFLRPKSTEQTRIHDRNGPYTSPDTQRCYSTRVTRIAHTLPPIPANRAGEIAPRVAVFSTWGPLLSIHPSLLLTPGDRRNQNGRTYDETSPAF